jgi:hypothetical protein
LMRKASSISQLVSYFTDAPLDGLRGESDAPKGQKPAP